MPRVTLSRLTPLAQWTLILPVSTLLAAGLWRLGLPAALLLGPMAAGILAGIAGAGVRVGRKPYAAAQAVLGCMIAGTVTPTFATAFLRDWPLFLAVVLVTILVSSLLGLLLALRGGLPGTTGVWGTSPGAAAAMVVMADAYGADVRMVAFMQYSRVICVALAASLVAHLWVGSGASAVPETVWFPPLRLPALAGTLALAAVGGLVGALSRIPSGAMLTPMLAGAILHATGLMTIELPEWLLAGTYALIGWRIGLVFTGEALRHAAQVLPQILLSILALIAFCGGLAFLLAQAVGVDPLTAYLATSPGGLDSVAIIAAGSPNVDMPFVMALQTVRFCLVVLAGPPLARAVARRVAGRNRSTGESK